MLRPRIIPCLLVQNGGLVKTTKFAAPKYIGDPLNAVRIFNEMAVDELMVIDIDATPHSKSPNEKLIAELAAECRMPFCYGGGVKSVEQVERLISIGVEKVALSSALIENPDLLSQAAERVGRQSIVAVIDVKKIGLFRKNTVVTHRGAKNTGLDPLTHAMKLEKMGAGEIVINSVDQDGMMQGYDLELADAMRNVTNVPLTILGGAGSMADIKALVSKHPIIGAAAGSLFVFKGKFRAVLINYPSLSERDVLASMVAQ
jgi:imidazole glycerol-phosphate synthase subunit HisF